MASSELAAAAAAGAAIRCDHNGNANSNATTPRTTPRKEKTILGWLVKSASVSDKTNDSESDNNNRYANANANTTDNNNSNCNCETRAFRDFRGVQTLRLLWSKRISSASEEAAQHYHQHHHNHNHKSPTGLGTLRKLNKSVSCLVNAFNNARDWPSLQNAPETRSKRAASLHNLQEARDASSAERETKELQRDKDNFNKYKNAEQAKMQNKLRRGSSSCGAEERTTSFPAVKAGNAAGERLQWPKRGDVVMPKCKMDGLSDNERERERHQNKYNTKNHNESQELISSVVVGEEQFEAHSVSLGATCTQNGSNESLQTINSINSNTTTATVTSQSTTTTAGTAATRSNPRRKYSFKTHAGKSFHQHHTPRRMSSHSHSHHNHSYNLSLPADAATSAASGSATAASGSLVRQLTQQFNEIIQKDARLLEQVKRKNGVWLARGAHVYKIVEKQPEQQTSSSLRSSMVQRNIKKFEKLEKPAVPQKTEQLLRKHHELTLSLSKQMRSKRARQQQEKDKEKQVEQQEREKEQSKLAVLPEVEHSTDEGVQSDVDDANKPKPQAASAESATTATTTPTTTTEELSQLADDNSDGDELDAVEAERQQRRKHKYASIYEKLRLPFTKRSSPKKQAALLEVPELQPQQQQQDEVVEPLPSPCEEASDSKLLAALEVIDQKLKILAEPGRTEEQKQEQEQQSNELLLLEHDDFEQRILPNNSFIYQAANKQISNNQLLLNQAVNVTLVNAIEGEQMIMEQKQLAKSPVMQLELQLDPKPDPMYEPITPTKETSETIKTEPQASSLFKITNQVEKVKEPTTAEDIYQTVEEAKTLTPTPVATPTKSQTNWLEGYESIAGSCEARNQTSSPNDDYEAFDTPTTPQPIPEEPVTRNIPNSTGTLGRNTRDQLPELPKPKRVMPQVLRPAPAKPNQPSRLQVNASSDEEEDENIYDTIKGCYDSMSQRTMSSNCYESISNYRKSKTTSGTLVVEGGTAAGETGRAAGVATGATAGVQLSSSGSSLTISSDHRTNSLYESSLAAGCVIYGSASVGCRSSLASSSGGSGGRSKLSDKRSSIAGSSDNSDAWVDISDGEATAATATNNEAQFIVVREQRFKQHRVRSPDWSKRIRDKRLQQNKAKSCIEDDSDHYYETLSPLGNKRHSTQLLPGQHHKRTQDLPRASQRRSKQHSASAHALGQHAINSDDYDSFETDSDEHTEQEQRLQHHNDSGVDMRNHRLPEPPAPQNQVYAIVRKFKDFISNKKSPKSSQQKLYENTPSNTQFYVECRKQELYEQAKSLSSSEKNLNQEQQQQQPQLSTTLMRAKQKNGKSLRSRLRKSLVGSSFDTKQLSTLTPTRSTFYIEDPPAQMQLQLQQQQQQLHGSGELDSGFSEKASSGDLPVPSAESQKFSTVARKAKKEAKAMRRRATIGVRPHEPPPPPPPPEQRNSVNRTPQTPQLEGLTQPDSWYAECGVFKQSSSVNGELATPTPSANGGGSSWYAESGLYQTSGNSVASSSGSSGVSTGNEAGLGDELQPHSLFSNEPLYQVYSAAKLESITRDLEAHENASTDGYEEIGLHAHAKTPPAQQAKARPTALQLVEPKNGPSRTLWSEIPEVINSFILPTLTPRERGLQEAKFEIMTSEASYLKSLNLLRRHFMNNTAFCDTSVLSARDRKALFSYIVPVHECSERLLTELECCWQNNIMLLGLSRCIYEIAERHFHVYITFCEHQGRMDRTLRRLKETKNGAFQQHLDKLESNPSCCGLNLHSFLMLPMQRITRLPLLIDAVFSKESPNNAEEYESWKLTLALVQKIVAQCNEAANRWEQAYELERISKQLEFPSHIRALAIAPMGVPKQGAKPRFLVKRGELTHLVWRGDDAKLTFGKRFSKSSIYAFLFSDLLVLCKRKGESNFSVFDYCPRSMLTLASGDTLPQLPTKDIKDPTSKNLMLMTLLENYERKTIELVLSCPSVSDQQRWLEAMRPPEAETPGEKLYESWDCPQVIAKHSYKSDEPDVLQLEQGDVVNVSRKLPDGWYQGERIRDGAVGWFPGSYTEELNSSHVRSRNLKQRHRLLTFTATYLEAQKVK
ncbi:uncharacterized protein LOC117572363 isoform X1 [Drosophila albomicans]|uniref:Uncharacterized protein LOC117572363 isoform X1 n=1 Tax=Drosophila albomicans TaxID=7291 RepID=A0A6P8XF38_DROAB|nr:uncharacterized protein LOC117572363 isoform X1 [Drosophila albomicans]XP_034111019.1 uncharacterized protein LOC117572363 isoform X1 [Drosophila albomicans]